MDDPYTMELRLCDDQGVVSHEPAPDCDPPKSYLDVLNTLRRHTRPFGEHKPVEEPFACTGSAHLWGHHIRCTSPAHQKRDWHGLYEDPLIVSGAAAERAREIIQRRHSTAG